MKDNYKSSIRYYYCLSKAGSIWGKKILKDILVINEGNNKINLDNEINKANSIRKKYINYKEEKEDITIYNTSSFFIFLKKWVLIETIIPYLAIPIITTALYLPLCLLNIENKKTTTAIPSSEKFIVTEEFIDQVLKKQDVDTVPLAPPTNVRLTSD